MTESHKPIAPEVAASIGRLQKAKQSQKASRSHATPSAIQKAFLPLTVVEGDISMPPVTMGKILILESIGSPFLRGNVSQIGLTDMMRALFVLAQQDNDLVREVVTSGDFDQVVRRWSDAMHPGFVTAAASRIKPHIDRAFDTSVRYEREGSGVPLAGRPSPVTGSGGSSPSPTA
jgi:hypothetical protein